MLPPALRCHIHGPAPSPPHSALPLPPTHPTDAAVVSLKVTLAVSFNLSSSSPYADCSATSQAAVKQVLCMGIMHVMSTRAEQP